MDMKQCSICKQTKNKSEFYKDKSKKDGLHYWCKNCHKEYYKKYYKTHQEEIKQKCAANWKPYYKKNHKKLKIKHKQYYEENKEAQSLRMKKLYNIHKEERLVKSAKYYEEHREEHITNTKKWRQANPKRYNELSAKAHDRRKRDMDRELISQNPFDESEEVDEHHVDNIHTIFLPKDLHRLGGGYSGVNVETHRINLSYIVNQIYGSLSYAPVDRTARPSAKT